MTRYAYLLALMVSQLTWGLSFDPPPLDPNPLLQGAHTAPGAAADVSPGAKGEQENATPASSTTNTNKTQRFKTPLVAREKTQVAVLGYHNFSETKTVTRMLMRTSELRAQMESIRNSDFSVISMNEFLEWRFGTRLLPEKCILITLDDGWRSVYTDAFPIFKEYGYPFHLFLYTTYLTGSGDSMTHDMIREMMQHGATIGSHSATHPYPADWKRAQAKGEEAYTTMIKQEIGETRQKLSDIFEPVSTYCYPGGYNDAAMQNILQEYGYVAAFTVIPGKVSHNEAPLLIDRYMILGTDSSVFEDAMDFSQVEILEGLATGYTPGALPRNTPKPTFAVTPEPDSTIPCTIPTITVNLTTVPNIDMSTVTMRVSGFGYVQPQVNKSELMVQWTAPCRIYMPLLSVYLSWKTTDGTAQRAAWMYRINRAVPTE